MRILLVNVDSRFNIAIRKMYTFYKSLNDDVELMELGFSAYPHKRTKTINADAVMIKYLFPIFLI